MHREHPTSQKFRLPLSLPRHWLLLVLMVWGAIACQPTQSVPKPVIDKAESYLRSQLKLHSGVTITNEAQTVQLINQGDICQTTEPTQSGFQIVLVAEGSRYTLHANQDGSNMEICTAQDAQPDAFTKYTGAGYTVKYPQSWQVFDEGLEPNGANRVQFVPPDRTQGFIVVERLPQQATGLNTTQSIKNFREEEFNATRWGASSGIKQEYVELVVAKSGEQQQWQVKTLLLKIENFVYKVQLFSPEDESPLEKDFELFMQEFQLIK